MNLAEYQKKARSTAIYADKQNTRMVYPALGLVGECGEVAEKIKKLIRDDDGQITQKRADAVAKELGDCCWYLANIAVETNLELEMMYSMRGASNVQRVRRLDLPRLVLHMNRHAIDVATALEAWLYTNGGRAEHQYQYIEIPQHITSILACIEEMAHRFGFTLEEIYVANIDKLAGRKKRGKLQGDGDNR